jgi:membrane protease YdiL (CAAX protease family)
MPDPRPAATPRWAIPAFLILVFPLSWYSWLLGYADDPGNTGINPLGPLVAALLVAAAGGWADFKAWLRAIVRARAPLLAVASVAIMAARGARFPVAEVAARWPEVADPLLVALLFVALGEEPGWRGWLLPRLQERMAPHLAALAIAPVWALWHLPMLGEELPWDQLGAFLVSVAAASLVLAWLTNRAAGGVLPAMLCHATVNAVGGGFLFTFFAGPDSTLLRWINALLWAVAALAVVWMTRGRLGLRAATAPSSATFATGTAT